MAELSEKMKKKMEKRREDMRKGQGGNYPYFLVKEGTTRFRILNVGEENEPGIEIQTVYLNKDLGVVISPATFGMKCAFDLKYQKLSKSSSEADQKLAKLIKPKPKVMVPAVRFNDEKGKELDEAQGAKMILITKGLYADMLDLYLEPEQGDFTDPKEGYDLKLSRTGKTMLDTEYSCIPCKPTPCLKPYAKKIYDPEEMVKALLPSFDETREKLNAFISGLTDSEDEDEKPEEPKKNKSGKKKKKKRDL